MASVKVGLYARVSTDDQTSQNQLIELRSYAKRKGFEAVEFIDPGYSGGLGEDKRPALKALMEAARRKEIDAVVCWDLSRFARSMKHLVDAVENFRIWNVGFTTLRENIDTNTANGRLIFHIFAGLAEFERELIRERTKLGLARARAEGKTLGRPQIEKKVGQVIMLRAQGLSLREIGARLSMNYQTVARVLLSQNPPQKLASLS